jgi:hypothetical protein
MKVPEYGPQQAALRPDVGTGVAIQQAAPVAAFGVMDQSAGMVGDTLAQGAGIVGNAYLQAQQRIAKTTAEDKLTKYEREVNDFKYGTPDSYFNKSGKDAVDAAEPTMEELEKIKERYADEIDDPQAREMFERAATVMTTRDREDIQRYKTTQFKAWESATNQARIENSIEAGVRHWNDPQRLGEALAVGRNAVIAQNQGQSAETINEAVQTYSSMFYRGVAEAAISTSAKDGAEVLEEFENYLEPQDLTAMREKLNRKAEIEENQVMAMEAVYRGTRVVEQYWDDDNARQVIIDEVNTIENAELRDKTMAEAMNNLNMRLTARDEQRAATFSNVQKVKMAGGTVEQFIAAAPDQWGMLTGDQQAELRKEGQVKTDLRVWTDLSMLPQNELAQINPVDYIGVLDSGDYQKLVSNVASAKGIGTENDRVGWTRDAQVSQVMKGIYGDKVDSEQAQSFYSLVNSEWNFRRRQKGSELTSQEFDDMLNGLAVDAATQLPDSFLGIRFDNAENLGVEDIPAKDLSDITSFLHEQGLPATTATITEVYRQLKAKELAQ